MGRAILVQHQQNPQILQRIKMQTLAGKLYGDLHHLEFIYQNMLQILGGNRKIQIFDNKTARDC